ncbi:MAG: gamma carbonic anhydrase family protein [Planctomycetes bacterium]|nr:gamma carbonic anhydrase family protein [Planctomycetota bacterium]
MAVHEFLGRTPRYDASNYLAPSAELIGDVHLGAETSVWFHVTIRGDVNWIRIGERSNVQDNAVIHVTNRRAPTRIGNGVSIAHSAVLHGCTVEDDVLIGIGAIVMDHAVIGRGSLIAAGALVSPRTVIPPDSLVMGSPGKVVRPLNDDERKLVRKHAENYLQYSRIYRGLETPERNPFYDESPES